MGLIFNLIKRIIKTIIKLSLYLAIFVTVIVLIPNLPPYTKFTSIELSPTQPRVGPLAPNEALNNAQRSYKDKLLGPEAFQIFKGELYTSLATGEIVKLSPGGHVTFVTTVGQPCSGLTKEHICGRPLGFQIDDKAEYLYVADAYHGIWKVDLKTNKKQLLVSPRVEIEKRKPKLFNSIALAKNGDLYWTDSTSDYHLKDGATSFLTDPSGRLFHYDAAKNQSRVLLDDLWFANGVVLSPNNEFVVVSESSRSKLTKYYVAGPKKGRSEVFADGLPGVPDNSRVLPDGSGILVALYTVFDEDHPVITRSLAPTPVIRKFLARLQRLVELPFEYLNNVYPHIIFEEIEYYIGHFKSISGFTPAMSGLLQLDWDGNVVASYYNTDGTLGHISDAIVHNDKLYTGSPHLQEFVGTVTAPPLLKKAFESSKKSEAPKVETKSQQAKPVQQAPKQKTEEKPKAKVEEKPKAKVEEKPKAKVQEKPKAETKPKVEEKPKPVEVKPKVEEKKEAPKVAKPVAAERKPAQQTKPVEPVKQATPTDKKSTAATPQQAPATPPPQQAPATPPPQQAPAKPSPQQAPATPPPQQAPATPPPKPTPTVAKPEPTKKPTQTDTKPTAAKPEVKTTPPPKPAEKTTPPPPKKNTPKATETKTEAPKVKPPPVQQESPKTAEGKPKPIREEIPSDTAKPTKETLKVIKKDGPTEIPVLNK